MPALSSAELIAFNEELAAMVQAGIPLEQGLAALRLQQGGQFSRVADTIVQQLQQGTPLPQVLSANLADSSPAYRALIEAGLRSGDLSGTFRFLAQHAQSLEEVRRNLTLALAYPLIIVTAAYLLCLFTMRQIIGGWLLLYQDLQLDHPGYDSFILHLLKLADANGAAVMWIPPLLVGGCVIFWLASGEWKQAQQGQTPVVLRCFPWFARIMHAQRLANFSGILGGLIERQVPLVDALPLAAETTGDPRFAARFAQAVNDLRRGETTVSREHLRHLSPYLSWFLSTPQAPSTMVSGLRQAAEMYFARARLLMDYLQVWMPPLLIVGFGGPVVLLYIGFVLWPLLDVWHVLGIPL